MLSNVFLKIYENYHVASPFEFLLWGILEMVI